MSSLKNPRQGNETSLRAAENRSKGLANCAVYKSVGRMYNSRQERMLRLWDKEEGLGLKLQRQEEEEEKFAV